MKCLLPGNVSELPNFLMLASYYRRFVKNFSSMTQALHRMLEKNESHSCKVEHQRSFERLKSEIGSSPVLAFTDFEKKLLLDTVGSEEGISGILSQYDADGVEAAIAFFSRSLAT